MDIDTNLKHQAMWDPRLAVMLASVGFVMCGCFDNCVGVFTVFLYFFVYVYLFLFVTSVRTTATE